MRWSQLALHRFRLRAPSSLPLHEDDDAGPGKQGQAAGPRTHHGLRARYLLRQVRRIGSAGAQLASPSADGMARSWALRPGPDRGVSSMTTMHPVKARVKNGRLVLDVPTDLPEGEEV